MGFPAAQKRDPDKAGSPVAKLHWNNYNALSCSFPRGWGLSASLFPIHINDPSLKLLEHHDNLSEPIKLVLIVSRGVGQAYGRKKYCSWKSYSITINTHFSRVILWPTEQKKKKTQTYKNILGAATAQPVKEIRGQVQLDDPFLLFNHFSFVDTDDIFQPLWQHFNLFNHSNRVSKYIFLYHVVVVKQGIEIHLSVPCCCCQRG